jgi:sigma-B regulation protein RsbU (phosphoserine phosphatase)
MFPGRSFTARLIIPLTAGCALVIAGGLFLDFQLSRERIVSDLEEQARRATTAAGVRLEEMASGVESAVRLLGEAMHEMPDEAATIELLRGIIDSNRHIFGATVALAPERSSDPRGFAPYLYRDQGRLARADLSAGETFYWQQPWFRDARERGAPTWVEPYFDADGGRVLMTTFSAPIYSRSSDGRGEFLGVVTADIALADLHEYLEALRIDSAGFGFLLTQRGTLVGSPLGPVIAAPIDQAIRFEDPEAPRAFDTAGAAYSGDGAWAVRCPRSDDDCELRLRRAGVGNWLVGVVYSEERLLEPLRNYEARVLSVGIAMLLVLALMIGAITRRLVRPLRSLAEASEAIARGNLRVTLPTAETDDEVGQLLRAFDRMRQDLGGYIEEVERAAAQRSRMDGELEAAREIQMAMLPQGGTAREKGSLVELWARVRPAREVGGDLYSYQRYGDRLLFSIGDVSDKGVPAALFMARAISLIQQWEVQPTTISPDLAMRQLNEALVRDNDNCMFLTLLLGVLDKRSGELTFASGGHGEPRLIRSDVVHRVPQQRGPALGLSSGVEFPLNSVQLQSGDLIALYTDGFDEAHNRAEEMLGEDRMDALLTGGEAVDALGERVFRDVDAFCGDAPQFDDMTLLLISLDDQRDAAVDSHHSSLPIDAALPRAGMTWLRQQWLALDLWHDGLADTLLVLEEALCNVLEHSGATAEQQAGLVIEKYRDRIELTISDPGRAHDPLTQSQRATLGRTTKDATVGGLGLHLITALTDSQSYRREGGRNILRLVRRIPDGAGNAASGQSSGGLP